MSSIAHCSYMWGILLLTLLTEHKVNNKSVKNFKTGQQGIKLGMEPF